MTLEKIAERQKEFQRAVGFPIDSISETDRNELSEKYVFKLIEEAIELRREFPSVVNPWSKHQKAADIQRVKEEFADVALFLMNIALVWKFTQEDVLSILKTVQERNFQNLKKRKMDLLNADILKIPGRVSGIGSGSLSPEWVFIGQNPSKNITQGYKFWSDPNDGSSKTLLPILEEVGVDLKDCYFTNVVKCTTPNNEEPSEELSMFYQEFLGQELDILRIGNPGMKIIAMGKWTETHCKHDASIKHPAVVSYGTSIDDYRYHVDKVLESLQ